MTDSTPVEGAEGNSNTTDAGSQSSSNTPPANLSANPPQNPPAQAPAQPQQNSADLLNAINSMPERIVNAIREATAPTNPPAQAPANSATTPPANTPGKKKYPTFFHRWYGISE